MCGHIPENGHIVNNVVAFFLTGYRTCLFYGKDLSFVL